MKLYLIKLKLLFLLFFFILSLFLYSITPSFLIKNNIAIKRKITKISYLLITVLSLLLLLHNKTLFSQDRQILQTQKIELYTPKNTSLYLKNTLTKKQIEEKIKQLEIISKQQPKSRDILLNLNNLKKALNTVSQEDDLLQKAKSIDPNNQFFK